MLTVRCPSPKPQKQDMDFFSTHTNSTVLSTTKKKQKKLYGSHSRQTNKSVSGRGTLRPCCVQLHKSHIQTEPRRGDRYFPFYYAKKIKPRAFPFSACAFPPVFPASTTTTTNIKCDKPRAAEGVSRPDFVCTSTTSM